MALIAAPSAAASWLDAESINKYNNGIKTKKQASWRYHRRNHNAQQCRAARNSAAISSMMASNAGNA